MRLGYTFSNLCGSVYKCGNVLFTPDGNSLLSPVGNRVTVFNLTEYVPVVSFRFSVCHHRCLLCVVLFVPTLLKCAGVCRCVGV